MKSKLLTALLLILALSVLMAGAASAKVIMSDNSLVMGLTEGVNDVRALSVRLTSCANEYPVSWNSSNEQVASVTTSGLVRANGFGTALVRASAGKAGSATCKVTVRRIYVSRIGLNASRGTLYAGRSGYQLTSRVYPSSADIQAVAWSSKNENVATVSETGYVSPVAPGATYIYCRATDGSGKYARCRVTVKAVTPKSVALNETAINLNMGTTTRLEYAVTPADATNKAVSWSSSAKSVAAVSADGVVTAIKPGKTTITCTTRSGGVKARCVVRVGYYDVTFRAMVIGQSDYVYAKDLPGGFYDAQIMKNLFASSTFAGTGFAKIDVRYNLTYQGIASALASMRDWGVDENDITYFYYSGHGSRTNASGMSYLCGTDGSNMSMTTLKEYLDALPGTVVILLDSCYSGGATDVMSKSANAVAGTAADTRAFNQDVVNTFAVSPMAKSVNAKSAAPVYKVMTACAADELSFVATASDGSFFTYYMGLGAGYATSRGKTKMYADANANKYVSFTELFKYTKPRVQKKLDTYGGGYIQTVTAYPSGDAFYAFARS